MNSDLWQLIDDYLAAVQNAVSRLQASGVQLPATCQEWAASSLPNRGILAGGLPYLKHGYGCTVGAGVDEVDFDFGQNGETNGFDGWRLSQFAAATQDACDSPNWRELEQALASELERGALAKRGNLYYLTCQAA
jgi:hypothetical protein